MKLINKLKARAKKYLNHIYKIPFLKKPFPRNPYCKKPLALKKDFLKLHKEAIANTNKLIDKYEIDSGYAIPKEYINKLALYTQICIKKSELNFQHGKLLYSSLSKYINDIKSNYPEENIPIIVLETGTARGFSSICMSKAFSDNNANGTIITIDCVPHNERLLWNSINDLNGPKSREENLSDWEKELSRIVFIQGWTEVVNNIGLSRINFAFLDAQHTKDDVMFEFEYVSKRQKKGDIVIFDDVTTGLFNGVCDAILEIEKNYPYEITRIDSNKARGYAIAIKK